MKLPPAPNAYDPRNEQAVRGQLEQEDARNLKENKVIIFKSGYAPVLQAPDGGLWRLDVDNVGALSTAPYP